MPRMDFDELDACAGARGVLSGGPAGCLGAQVRDTGTTHALQAAPAARLIFATRLECCRSFADRIATARGGKEPEVRVLAPLVGSCRSLSACLHA